MKPRFLLQRSQRFMWAFLKMGCLQGLEPMHADKGVGRINNAVAGKVIVLIDQ